MRTSPRKILFGVVVAFSLLMISDCKKSNPASAPPEESVDTTSHNFTFTKYTFGGEGGSSYFKDVAIINDNDIWCVGAIYTDSGTYNAAHWDGFTWNLKRILYSENGQSFFSPISSILAFSPSDIWFERGIHYDGKNFNSIPPNIDFPGPSNKMWGLSSNDFYIVGNGGLIAHSSNGWLTKMESNTTIDLRDVWGTSDPEGAGGKTVWACGESNDGNSSILLKYEIGQWKTVWQRNGSTSVDPYGYDVGSVWYTDSTGFLTSSNGIFQIKDSTVIKMENNISTFSRSLRGNNEHDMVTSGEGGTLWHWNGRDWKKLVENGNYFLLGCNLNNNVMIAIGTDFSIGLGSALIYVGKRE